MDLKHSNNEVYVDLVEDMDAIINRSVVKDSLYLYSLDTLLVISVFFCSFNVGNLKFAEFLECVLGLHATDILL